MHLPPIQSFSFFQSPDAQIGELLITLDIGNDKILPADRHRENLAAAGPARYLSQ